MEEQTPEVQSQPVQSPAPVVPERKSSLPLIIILLVAILLVGIGGVYAGMQIGKKQVTPNQIISQPPILPTTIPTSIPTQLPEITSAPTPDATTNWKTYTNTEYGFSVKIPLEWGSYSMKDFSFSKIISPEEQYLYLGPSGSTLRPPQSMQISVEKKDVLEGRAKTGMQEKNCSDETVGVGKEGVTARKTVCDWNRGPSFVIEKGDFVYTIDNVVTDSSKWSLFDQILSTFKFTN